MLDWPAYRKARDLSGSVFPVSEAVILAAARKHGIGRKFGRAMIFSAEDVHNLYEALPCPSNSSAAKHRRTGNSGAPSAESEYGKALQLLTDATPKKTSEARS